MAEARQADNVKLICGMISAHRELFGRAAADLSHCFGAVDLISEIMPFDMTHYYDDEMGAPLSRQFVSFAQSVRPDVLADVKLKTNEIEAAISASQADGRRAINLDPGCVTPASLILASCKNFSHRIYLGRGVYAEVTMMYRAGNWEPLAWTFPDFASGRYDAFLTGARSFLRAEMKKEQT